MSALANDEGDQPTSAAGAARPRLSAQEWLLLMVLAAVQFNHIVDFMIIMPLGPVYTKEMGLSPGAFGGLVSAYTISAAVANVLAAFFVDRFDRKRALLTAFAGFTTGTLLCAIAPDYVLLLAARIVAGAFGGVAAGLVMAIIGDTFHDRRRGTAMGVVMSAFSIAASVGLPLGLYFADLFGWHAPFAILAAISAGVLLLAALALPPMRGHLAVQDGTPVTLTDRVRDFGELLSDANHVRAFALMVAMMFSSFMAGPYVALFLEGNVGTPQHDLKFIYLCGGLATIPTTMRIGRLSDRYGKLRLFRVVAFLTMVPLLWITLLPQGTSLWVVLAITTAQMVTMSGRMVPAMAMITGSAAPGQRGSFMSLNTAVQHLSAGLASFTGGVILSQADARVSYPLVGVLSCVAILVSLYLAGRLRHVPEGDLAPDASAVSEVDEPALVDGVPVLKEGERRPRSAAIMDALIEPFLRQTGVLILDGALATELELRGADLRDPLWSARLLLENPELIRQVHRDYFEAGADVATTASYQASLPGLERRGLTAAQAADVLRLSVRLAQQAREQFVLPPGRLPPLIAASIGCCGAVLHDGSEYRGDYGLSVRQLMDWHRPRLQILAASGADLLACETIPCLVEAEALVRLLEETSGVPAWISFSCRDERHLCHGETFADAVMMTADCANVLAAGVNCTPPRYVMALLESARVRTDMPLIAYPNSGECWDAARQCWQATADALDWGAAARVWHGAGARLIGGCCRTTPDTIRAMRAALVTG